MEGAEMRVIVLVVRDFDGSKRQVIGEIDFPIQIGPHMFTITFQVMDINLAYTCLLRTPCIHVVGVVTSTLHKKQKFMIEDKLVIVCGEEDLLVSDLSPLWFVETDEGVIEVPFHCLEFEDVNTAISNLDKAPEVILSSIKSAKETLEKVNPSD